MPNILPPADDPSFPAALAAARQGLGISAAELARRAGISPTMVSRYENTGRDDHHRPRQHTVAQLEKALRGEHVESPTAAQSENMPLLSNVSLEMLIEELKRRGFGVTLIKPPPG